MKNLRFRDWTVPLALLAAGLAAFGLLMPRLGFYWDDWNPILVNRLYGVAGFWRFYALDRPSSAWSYVVFAPLLGGRPLAWQAFTFGLRWLSAVAMWWAFTGVWPQARWQSAAAALLFMVYPVFTQQPIAVTYHQLWLEYLLFFLSLGAMVQAARSPVRSARFWLYTLSGLAAFAVNFSISEYFIGVELLRPALLWIVLLELEPTWRKRLGRTALLWSPYLLALGAFIYWRLFLLHIPGGDPNKPYLLYGMFTRPLQTARELGAIISRDVVQTLFSSWYRTLNPGLFELDRPFTLLAWAVALATAAAAAFYLLRLNGPSEPDEGSGRRWLAGMAVVGALALLLGPFPAWITGRFMVADVIAGELPPDPFSDRYAASAMFGAALLLVAFLEWLTPRRLQKALLLGILVGLAAGAHMRTANEYRWFWVQQQRFFWQMHWRAPAIQPGTALLARDDIFPLQGRFATSVALNLAYPQEPGADLMRAWVISVDRKFANALPALREGVPFDESFRIFNFKGSSRDSLAVHYEPEKGACLWVLGPSQTYAPGLGEAMHEAVFISNLARISAEGTPGYPPRDTFGREPAHTWCYFFEKADLARQHSDWPGVIALAEQARAKGYAPGRSGSDIPFEWLPFVEGYAHAGQWDQATALTLELSKTKHVSTVDRMLCRFWGRLRDELPAAQQKDNTLGELNRALSCGW